MSASYSHYSIFSKIEVTSLNIAPSIGQYIIEFLIRFTPHNPHKGGLILSDFSAAVLLGSNRLSMTTAQPRVSAGTQHSISIKHQAIAQHERQISFFCHIARTVLEAVEEIRNGQDVEFIFGISGTATGVNADEQGKFDVRQDVAWPGMVLFNAQPSEIFNPETFYCETQLKVPLSQWGDILKSAGYQPALLFEISFFQDGEHSSTHLHVKDAQKAFIEGRYADVVSRCRDALDSFATKDETGASYLWAGAGKKESREGLPIEDNFRLSWAALHLITNSGHHRNKMKAEFTRPMAHYVLGATCLVLSLASKERDMFMRPPTQPSEENGA